MRREGRNKRNYRIREEPLGVCACDLLGDDCQRRLGLRLRERRAMREKRERPKDRNVKEATMK